MRMMNKDDLLRYASPDILNLNPELVGERETHKVGGEMKKNKFGAIRTRVDGITFDSKKEARRFIILDEMRKRGDIEDLVLQPKFELMPKFVTPWGEKVRAITYTADFMYKITDEFGVVHAIIEDVKGGKATQTQVFKIKWKLLKYAYRERPFYEFRIVS